MLDLMASVSQSKYIANCAVQEQCVIASARWVSERILGAAWVWETITDESKIVMTQNECLAGTDRERSQSAPSDLREGRGHLAFRNDDRISLNSFCHEVRVQSREPGFGKGQFESDERGVIL